jgi:hypothetical protein
MLQAAAEAISCIVTDDELNASYIVRASSTPMSMQRWRRPSARGEGDSLTAGRDGRSDRGTSPGRVAAVDHEVGPW